MRLAGCPDVPPVLSGAGIVPAAGDPPAPSGDGEGNDDGDPLPGRPLSVPDGVVDVPDPGIGDPGEPAPGGPAAGDPVIPVPDALPALCPFTDAGNSPPTLPATTKLFMTLPHFT